MKPVIEQTEAPSAAAPMPNVGSLERVAIPEILKRVNAHELSGSLEATAGTIVRTIYFDRGFIVFTSSTSKSERLGQCLLEAGRVTEEGIAIAVDLMTGRRRIGESMVEAGLIDEEELGQALVHQARQVATAIYALEQGMYRFDEQECPIPMELRLSLSMYRLQLEAVRKIPNHELIVDALPPFTEPVRLSECPPFSFEDVRFEPVELLAMEAAQKERPLGKLMERVNRGSVETERAIYGLLCAGILERVGPDGASTPLRVQEETGTFLLSALGDDSESEEAENVRQEVLLEFERSEHAAAESLLGVDADASEEDVRGAFADRMEKWDTKLEELDKDTTLCLKVDEIKNRLAQAKFELLQQGEDREAPISEAPRPKNLEEEEKRLLRELKLRKIVEDEEGVISFLYELVRLEPEKAKYEVMLAQALAGHHVMRKKAERHFRRAVSLDSQNAKVHYLFGRYYQSFDMRNRALAEFKSALRIHPDFSEARRALVELKSTEVSLQDRLKRFFS